MKSKYLYYLFYAIAFICFTSTSYANSGVPLIAPFASPFYQPIILGLIIVETAFLRLVFKTRLGPTAGWMFLANMISGFVGAYLHDFGTLFSSATIYNLLWYSVLAWVLSFVLSVAIEFPFYYVLFRKKRIKSLIVACLSIHLAFYALLAPAYLNRSYFTSVGKYQTTRDLSFAENSNVWIYYIPLSRDSVVRMKPDGTRKETVCQLDIQLDPMTNALWLKREDESKFWDLHVVGNSSQLLLKKVAKENSWFPSEDGKEKIEYREKRNKKNQRVARYWPLLCSDLRLQKTEWNYSTADRWYLFARKPGMKRSDIVLQSPLSSWRIHNLSVLPEGYLLFEFGDQICLLDLPNKTLGMVAHGHRPIVVLNDEVGEHLNAAGDKPRNLAKNVMVE